MATYSVIRERNNGDRSWRDEIATANTLTEAIAARMADGKAFICHNASGLQRHEIATGGRPAAIWIDADGRQHAAPTEEADPLS